MSEKTLTLNGALARTPVVSTIAKNWALIFIAITIIVFSFTGRNFLALANFQSIIHLATTAFLLASAETFVIITGGIDLSVGFVMGLSAVSSAKVMQVLSAASWSPAASILTGLAVGIAASAICGFISGFLISRYNVPAFIATLGIQGVAIGVTFHICDGLPVGFLPPVVTDVGNSYLFYYHPQTGAFSAFTRPVGIAATQIKELVRIIPGSFLLIILVLGVLWYVLRHTRFGQHTYAIGGSMDAAVRAGINVKRHLLVIYMLSALLAGVAGVVDVFQSGTGNYTTFGANYELFAIAAVIIGGASLFGGKGRVLASASGVVLLKVLENGLNLSGVDPFYRYIAVGVILIIAVVIDQLFPDLF
ncbi:ABC transporter permease [Salinispira pacifica]